MWSTTMASKSHMSMSEELINAMYTKPYTGLIPYLSPNSALTVSDFEKCPLANDHWLDLPQESSQRKGRKKRDPNRVFEAFGFYSDHDPIEVREEMLSYISLEFNYFQTVAWLILQLCKISLSEWCNNMRAISTPGDELAIFALSKLYQRHSVVYTKDKTWSTIGTSTPMSEKEVYQQCDLKFILMGKGHFVQLIKKPSVSMPVLPLQPMESVYESGYYEDVTLVDKTTDMYTTPAMPFSDPQSNADLSTTSSATKQYCAVHDCEVTQSQETTQIESPTTSKDVNVSFPEAAKVCETSRSSTLQNFNPLNDSEPNLEFDMTDPNNDENPDLHVKLIQDAKTRKWQVKIRNLTPEQLDFIAGPRLLPTLAKTDAVVIEHQNPKSQDVVSVEKQPGKDIIVPVLPVPDNEQNSNSQEDVFHEKQLVKDITVPVPPLPDNEHKPKRPKRTTAKNINYATMTIVDDPANSDTDEYLPKPDPLPKPDNKRKPSASRIAAQHHKKGRESHDKPKPDDIEHARETPPDSTTSTEKSPSKGELKIKTVSLPKRVRSRSFRCQRCKYICHSEKERNQHHKDNHGPLSCAVCSEVFETPSGLHRHKYRHTDLKFTCESCGENFPFESQLKDHRIKHLSIRSHSCFTKDCGHSFKNKSSLIRHLKEHEGKEYHCPADGCPYSSKVERNLKAHMINHSDTHPYSCPRCGQAFKHHTQMTRHVNNKVCHPSK